MFILKWDSDAWEVPVTELTRLLWPANQGGGRQPLDVESLTYAFRTHEGNLGLLQFEPIPIPRFGVKIRYKLVQNATTAQPAATPAGNADFVAFHPVTLSTWALNSAREFMLAQKWQLKGKGGDNEGVKENGTWCAFYSRKLEGGGKEGVTIEAADRGGKHITFNETPQAGGISRFTVNAEDGAAMSAQEIGARLWQQIVSSAYRTVLLPKLQLAKSEAALQKLKSEVAQQAAALKTGTIGTAELRMTTEKAQALDAELKRFTAAWNKFEPVIARHSTNGLSYSELDKAEIEVNTAEARLRIVQATTENDADRESFGPVMERLVPANNEMPYPWFDLDAGRTIITLRGDDDDSADFVAITEPGNRSLATGGETGFGSVPLEAAQWDMMTPSQLTEQLKSATADSLSGEEPLPKTYGFTTRSGGIGLLQITGFTENPRGVKIRYKLVQSEKK